MQRDDRPDFEQAMGESFGEHVSPPVPFEDASPHECCEVVWFVFGREVTPSTLDNLDEATIRILSHRFGEYFECESPSADRIRNAIVATLARWPVGSLNEDKQL